ncbi:sigma-70 family RNA polymerase sigma factor [Actinoplanes sp. KI2]|uniref:RNA polymerase sigma factor n=1 Tax=Actinoplanes sp. KI2 TaxID=2983315 RepID=UPI0021D5B12C|nr:sigma-70 family RNA polymerase sigma factor [Actinoplanes sp. KI2]MCU7726445.1 sigma-70 family RNA polymerase sigma factor [Actinoplanes sp. KI2]
MVLGPDGFDEFFRRSAARIVLFLIKIGASREEAEDSVQEAMASAYLKWHEIDHPEAWVRLVAERNFIAAAERARSASFKAVRGGWCADRGQTDVDLTEFDEEQRVVLSLIRSLPYQQRRAMAWYYDGFEVREIATRLGKSEATVRSHLRHARHQLRRKLNAYRVAKEGAN